jgi:hypothetical protein
VPCSRLRALLSLVRRTDRLFDIKTYVFLSRYEKSWYVWR